LTLRAGLPEALEALRRLDPDLVLLDFSPRGANGLELIKSMKTERPELAILVISMW
jgi:DNA-binding NarL/FixJ family response regulator